MPNVYFGRYFEYNWFALYIDHHLPVLRQFKFHLSVIHLEKSFIDVDRNILDSIQDNFKQIHNNRLLPLGTRILFRGLVEYIRSTIL